MPDFRNKIGPKRAGRHNSLHCMSPLLARFDRSLQRRKTSGIEGEAEVYIA
jgi:hypothetical protein